MKTILITGATDGLGLATAKMLCEQGQRVIIHGRSDQKIEKTCRAIFSETGMAVAGAYKADLSDLEQVRELAERVKSEHHHLDVLINNAGVYTMADPIASNGLDARLVVNMIAPYLLTRELMPLLGAGSRVVNLSSAAQAPISPSRLSVKGALPDGLAYAQSKLGVTMWTNALAAEYAAQADSPIFVSINPKSFLATPMVQSAYGVSGTDVRQGAEILTRAALSDDFAQANGRYYDNDRARFASPHPDGLNLPLCQQLVAAMDQILKLS